MQLSQLTGTPILQKEIDGIGNNKISRVRGRLDSKKLPDTDEEADSTVKKIKNGDIEGTQVLSAGQGIVRSTQASRADTAKFKSFHQEVSSPQNEVTQFAVSELPDVLQARPPQTTRNRSHRDYLV